LLSQHAIAQSGVDPPEFLQGIADRRGRAIQLDVRAAAREFRQITRNLKSNHVGAQAFCLRFASILLAI
jgi:hypothetical protein